MPNNTNTWLFYNLQSLIPFKFLRFFYEVTHSLFDDVTYIALNVSQSNIVISDADSINTDSIIARALDVNGAMISGIPF